jgi:flagellar hook-basal body complex protein FliE
LNAIKPVQAAGLAEIAAGAPAVPRGADFARALGQALERVDAAQANAESVARAYQAGAEGTTLESTVVALQEASVSLQFAVQVRNRLVNAYHDIMNMPV